ncbi:MAG: hypothetical protein HRT36_09245, partial [Alphaproteobacteria bacterium]|nr:hypothetical protein [Alphaproteobacteria bacterium]
MAKPDPLEQLERSLENCFGALAGEPTSSVAEREAIRDLMPKIDRRRLPKETTKVRGELDHLALKTRFHEGVVHQRNCPASMDTAAVFNALERARYEALGMQMYRGVVGNIDAMDQLVHAQMSAEAMAGQSGTHHLPEAARLLLREKILGVAHPKQAEALIAPWRGYLAPALEAWHADQAVLESQTRFADWAQEFLEHLGMSSVESAEETIPNDSKDSNAKDSNVLDDASDQAEDQEQREESQSREQTMLPLDSIGESEGSEEGGDARLDYDDLSGEIMPAEYEPHDLTDINSGDYRVFTSQYDEEVNAEIFQILKSLRPCARDLMVKWVRCIASSQDWLTACRVD